MLKRVLLIGELSKTCKIALDVAVANGAISEYRLFDSGNVPNLDDNWILCKGYIHTEDFLRTIIPIVKNMCAVRSLPKPFLTHCAILKNNDKQFILTDGVCVPCPDDVQRAFIISNAANLWRKISKSTDICNVSLLSAGGDTNANTNPELHQWWQNNRNEFNDKKINLRLEQLDVALNADIRAFKKINGAVADVVVCPDINMGNCIWKCLTTLTNGWLCGGILTGAPIRIVLNSRGDSPESMLFSIQIANKL